nr:fimbrial protein [Dyella sp. ASV24]
MYVIYPISSHRRRLLLRVLAAIFMIACSMGVFAAPGCSGGKQVFTIAFPASVSVSRDASVGTMLTTWVLAGSGTVDWTCSLMGSSWGSVTQGPTYTLSSGVTTIYAGTTVTVYNTNVAGVGIAYAHRDLGNDGATWSSWTNVTPTWYGNWWSNAGAPQRAGEQVAAALVKTGVVATGGQIPGNMILQSGMFVSTSILPDTINSFNMTSVNIVPLACTTPSITVPLGNHSASEMGSVGASTATVSFNINLNNCPAGMKGIQYEIDPATTVLSSAHSVVALDSSSSAAGVGVQLLDGAGAVFPLNTPKSFSEYNASTGGSYAIPLRARYYQTLGTVKAGTANTSMTFTMTYQ